IHAWEANLGVLQSQPESADPVPRAAAAVIVAQRLVKRFGERPVVCGIDFAVEVRECVGILGPNGAGKTTTIRMVTCQSPVGGGEIRVFGLPVSAANERAIKARLGIVPQEDNLDPDLSVLTNLLVYASYYGIPRRVAEPRATQLLELFALSERGAERIE